MAKVLQLVSFYNQRSLQIYGISGKTEQDEIITTTDIDTYSINTDSIFNRICEDYFGQDYTDTRLNQYYKTSLEVKHSVEPFSIKAGNDYILGEGSWLHAQSYVNNIEWKKNFSVTEFRNCWEVNQKDTVKITAADERVDIGVLTVNSHSTVPFDNTIQSVTFTLDQTDIDLPKYLSSSAFSETTFSAYDNGSRLDVDLDSVTWQDVKVESDKFIFNNVHLKGSISNGTNQPRQASVRLSVNFNLYKTFAGIYAKAQIYDHASDSYDSPSIYGNARFYYLYYGSSSDATNKINCLSFTSSKFEDPDHPNQEITSSALVSAKRKPSDTQLETYKPGSTYTVAFWETQSPSVYEGAFDKDYYVYIYIKNVVPQWVNPSSTGLTLRLVSSDNLYYTSSALANSSFLDCSTGVETKKLTIPADASSVSQTFKYYSNNTGRLIKAVYTGSVIDSFNLGGSSISAIDKLSLQNRYLQVLINSSDTTMPQITTIQGSTTSFSRTPLPVAIKFDFESSPSKVEVYFYAKFNSSSSSGDINWRITSSYNLSLVLRSTKPSTTSNLGQDGQLLKDNRYYSFNWPKGYSKSGNISVAFDALFDASLDKVSFVDKLPDQDGDYSLDPWNKAYPSNYSLVYENEEFSPQEYRMGIIDSNFIPTFDWPSRGLSQTAFETTSGTWKSVNSNSYGTTYKLGLITTVNNGQISYTLRVAAKDESGNYNTYQNDYPISSPLILLKISAAGGNGAYATYGSPYKGGGGGGSGAAVWVLLDLTYTNWSDTASRQSNIYVFLGTKNRRTETEIKNKALPSFISFEEPVYNSSNTSVYVPSRDYFELGPGNDGNQYQDETKQNFGGNGGILSTHSEVDGSGNWCSYCYLLKWSDGANGGRGENNSDKTGGSFAKRGDSFDKVCCSVRNRYSKIYQSSSIFTDAAFFDGGGTHVHSNTNPWRTFSPGGGGAASAFNSAKTIEGNEPKATSFYGAGGAGGCYYNYDGGTANDSPSYGGDAYAQIYCLLKSS